MNEECNLLKSRASFRKHEFFCFSDYSNMSECELEGQKRKKVQYFIPSHTGPKQNTMKVYMGTETNLCPCIILVLRKSASHVTAGKTITSIHWGISNLIREEESLTNM
jgi:hypothetical protein